MKAASLPTRIAYAAAAFVLSGAVMFFYCMRVLPQLTGIFPELDPEMDGYRIFKIAICAAGAMGFSLCLYELTQPGTRPRKRRGRRLRLAVAGVVVVMASLAFNGLGLGWIWDLLFAAWLTYTVAYTFVRYGVMDEVKRLPDALEAYQTRRGE
jgi:hypothetical protein